MQPAFAAEPAPLTAPPLQLASLQAFSLCCKDSAAEAHLAHTEASSTLLGPRSFILKGMAPKRLSLASALPQIGHPEASQPSAIMGDSFLYVAEMQCNRTLVPSQPELAGSKAMVLNARHGRIVKLPTVAAAAQGLAALQHASASAAVKVRLMHTLQP